MEAKHGFVRVGIVVAVMAMVVTVVGVAGPAGATVQTFPGHNGRIGFASNAGDGWAIWSSNLDGSDAVSLAPLSEPPAGYHCASWVAGRASGPSWSPNGSRIAYTSGGDVWVMDADGTGSSKLTSLDAARISKPVWAPDGSKIAVIADLAIFIVDPAGGVVRRIDSSVGLFSDFDPPSWSPDSTRMAVTVEQSGAGPSDVYVARAGDGGLVPLTSDGRSMHPAWSPDGTSIAYTSRTATGVAIYAMGPDGTDQRKLVDLPTPDFWPQWSPDGSRLMFTSYDGTNFRVLVYTAGPAGGDVEQLPFDQSVCHPIWSPDGTRILFVDDGSQAWVVDAGFAQPPVPVAVSGRSPDWQAVPGAAPAAHKRLALDHLAGLLPSGDGKDDRRIERAIERIEASLDPALWVDEANLTEKGYKVFDRERQAVKELMKVDVPGVQLAVDLLLGADEVLATNALDLARAAGGKAKEIERAERELAQAAGEVADGDFDKAVGHYRKAWQHAVKAT